MGQKFCDSSKQFQYSLFKPMANTCGLAASGSERLDLVDESPAWSRFERRLLFGDTRPAPRTASCRQFPPWCTLC
jgi:hypothetical protein